MAAASAIKGTASELTVSKLAGSKAARQQGAVAVSTDDHSRKSSKKIDTTGSAEERNLARIAENTHSEADAECPVPQAITGSSRHFGLSDCSEELLKKIKSTEKLIEMAASTGEININQLIERLDKEIADGRAAIAALNSKTKVKAENEEIIKIRMVETAPITLGKPEPNNR